MNATEYQKQAARTLIDAPGFYIDDDNMMILWNALGLVGEAGEVAEMVKKGILHQHGLFYEKMAKELGDCLWYIAALCTRMELDMGEVMAANIEKLKVRYPNGFSVEDSVKRVDIEATEDLDWNKAKENLDFWEKEYRAIGPAGALGLAVNVLPLQDRYARGERTKWLYDDIMGVE